MGSLTFVDFSDPKVDAAWLNDVDGVIYDTFGGNVGADNIRGNLGLGNAAAPSVGDILVGNGGYFENTQLVAGANVTITPGAGTITIGASGGGGGDPFAGYANSQEAKVANTVYTNTTTAIMLVRACISNQGSFATWGLLELIGRVDGTVADYYSVRIPTVVGESMSMSGNITLYVPPGSTYQIDATALETGYMPVAETVQSWNEFRLP